MLIINKTISSAGTHDAPVPALSARLSMTTSAGGSTVRGAFLFPGLQSRGCLIGTTRPARAYPHLLELHVCRGRPIPFILGGAWQGPPAAATRRLPPVVQSTPSQEASFPLYRCGLESRVRPRGQPSNTIVPRGRLSRRDSYCGDDVLDHATNAAAILPTVKEQGGYSSGVCKAAPLEEKPIRGITHGCPLRYPLQDSASESHSGSVVMTAVGLHRPEPCSP